MARTKGSKNIRKTKPAATQFESLDLVRKQICYNYWTFLDSKGKEGWDIKKAGYKDHWEISDYIRENVKEKSFYHLGKRMADIARLLEKEGLVLERPGTDAAPVIASSNKKRKVNFLDESTSPDPPLTTPEASPKASPALKATPPAPKASPASASSEQISESEDQESSEEESPMPKNAVTKYSGKSPQPDDLASSMASMSINPIVMEQTISGILPCPMLSGRWEKFNHRTKVKEGFCLMRLYLSNGIGSDHDFQFSWVNPRAFKIRIKWPIFMVESLMTTGLDMTEVINEMGGREEVETYGLHHPIYDSMGANAAHMAAGDQHIWSEGIFRFERDMKYEYEEKLFEIECKNGDKGTLLQIKFFEETVAAKNVSNSIQRVRRTINYNN